ncbi:hypothetical protein VTL71DRAFT_3505 [Oculimacula yallundae]|uniref:Uncharacterized protein n=1 Tax=Oculimacula yallundae TaxID=86028 RepID=A0ABR4C7C5_9HELO
MDLLNRVYDERYCQHKLIRYKGDLYVNLSPIVPLEHNIPSMEIAVAWTPETDDEQGPQQNGPENVLFNRLRFIKCEAESDDIKESALRTVPVTSYPQIQPSSPKATTTPAGQVASPHFSSKLNDTYLEYGFDLPVSSRATTQFIHPQEHNKDYGLWRMPPFQREVEQYLGELLERAMSQKKRGLVKGDFPALTEALHRNFEGQIVDGDLYAPAGWLTIYRRVFNPTISKYQEIKDRVLGQDD